MQVSLIVSASISDSYGFNILAAQLKKLEPQVHTKLFYIFYDFNKPYPESVLNQLAQLCQGSDLVGISLLSSAFKNSIQITKIIKEKVGCPVIWGGKHPTADPEDSIKYADMICIGEGEDVLIEVIDNLITGHSMENVAGIWYKENDVVHKNNLRVFETNLDRFIFPDYTLDKKFILDVSNMIIRPLEKKDLSSMIKWYPTMITRGCPNCCTFCTNSSDIRLRNMRARSVDNVIKEVKNFIVDNPGVKKVFFRDDCISAMSLSFIEELSAKWKKEVDLPCSCSGVIATSPEFEKKIELLVKAGFTDFKMGIQSGCERVRRFVFARVGETDEVIKKAVDILHRKCPGKINYYMITDNPYETEDELVQSIRFTSRLKRPFSLSLY